MAILNTTDIVDSSIMLKARLKHNMVGDNYYIQNLQYKRDQDWEYRYNTVDIEEEKDRQVDLFFKQQNAMRINWQRNHRKNEG